MLGAGAATPFPAADVRRLDAGVSVTTTDLRIPLELVESRRLFRGVEFKVFAGPAADPASRIAALKLPKGGELTRKEIDDYHALVAVTARRASRTSKSTSERRAATFAVADTQNSCGCGGKRCARSRWCRGRRSRVFGADKRGVVNEVV